MEYFKNTILLILFITTFGCASHVQCNNLNSCITEISENISSNMSKENQNKKIKAEYYTELTVNYELKNVKTVKSSGNKYIDNDIIKAIYLSSPFTELRNVENLKFEDYKEIVFKVNQ